MNPKSVIVVGLGCWTMALAPETFAVTPAPDGGYPGQNTAEGDYALQLAPVRASTIPV